MARFHFSAHATIAVAGRSDGESPQLGGVQAFGPPEDDPELYTVVAAAKLALPPGTRLCRLEVVTGAIYAKTGFGGDDDIVAPAGMLLVEQRLDALAVGMEGGRLHTHLLVIEANPTTDTAIDLNGA